jgi:Protein of unknown function (DUF3810)
MNPKRYLPWILVIVPALAIKIFSAFPDAVEKYYSTGIYPLIARLLRFIFGWIPFSIGDVIYLGLFIYIIYKIVYLVKRIVQKRISRNYLVYLLGRLVYILCCVYIVFNVLWGLNYDRRGISYQLQLDVQPYSAEELSTVLKLIAGKLNTMDSAAMWNRPPLDNNRFLFRQSVASYTALTAHSDIFYYPNPSIKPSIFSELCNYWGFSGYYNPFTAEAQVNTTVPSYIRPFTTCHEMGHQLGYAKENEANFSAYLSCKGSADPAYRYSVYFDLYLYAASELYERDSTLYLPIRASLNPGVKKDIQDLQAFFKKYENPVEPYIRRLYGNYLKANSQPKGLMAYDEVVGRVVAYYKKYKLI